MLKTILTGMTLGLAMTAVAARADDVTRYRGVIEKVGSGSLTIKPRVGEPVAVSIEGGVKIMIGSAGRLSDVKPDSYVGAVAMPQPDGSRKALQVTVYASSLRGTDDGQHPWDLRPGSTMTNGAVAALSGTAGRVIRVAHQGGETTITAPEDVAVTLVDPGDRSVVVVGAEVVAVTKKGADGKPAAIVLIVGRNGAVPSM